MKRLFGVLASMSLISGVTFLGCGDSGTETPRTAPGTDTRSVQEKETDDLLQKSQGDYNKKFKKK